MKVIIREPTVVTSIFVVNSLYASILFDSGGDKSFITPKFIKHLNEKSRKLDEPYIVEMTN